jgi:hypothetical protein
MDPVFWVMDAEPQSGLFWGSRCHRLLGDRHSSTPPWVVLHTIRVLLSQSVLEIDDTINFGFEGGSDCVP